MTKKQIPIFFDVDLTLTEEYQQEPLIRPKEKEIKLMMESNGVEYNEPINYLQWSNKLGPSKGVTYLTQIIRDARKGGVFEGLTKNQLYEFGKLIIPAPGLKDGLQSLKDEFKNEADLHYFFVSVGIQDLINGFIDAQDIGNLIEGVAASDFTTDKNGVIDGICDIVTAFGKNAPIIGFMKGDHELLNFSLYPRQYKFDYRNMVVVGDGFTDISKFAYSKKKGGTPIAVYKEGDYESYKGTVNNVGVWTDYILPRKFNPGFITFDMLKEVIQIKLDNKCNFRPSSLYDYKKGGIKNLDELAVVEKHINDCKECSSFYRKTFVTSEGTIERHNVKINRYDIKS